MSKIICGILLAAAFVYALYLVVTRRNLAKIKDYLKGKNAFTLATFICCAMIMFAFGCKDEKRNVLCYEDVASVQTEIKLTNMLKSAWLVLDYNKDEEFQKLLNDAIQKGLAEKNTEIGFAYRRISRYIAHKNGRMFCYLSGISEIQKSSSEQILNQLQLMNKAKNEGKLDADTIRKIENAIAYQLEALMEFQNKPKDKTYEKYLEELKNRYNNNELKPSEEIKKATGIIVEMEKSREKWDLGNESK